MQAVQGCPLVTIAAMYGAALTAGGAGLISACDFVVAAEQDEDRVSGDEARARGGAGDELPPSSAPR